MRYSGSESTFILGSFGSGDSVTITVYRLSDNAVVVNGASCSEVGSTGVFKYEFSQTITSKTEYLWEMTNGSYTRRGKIVLGGYVDYIDESVSSRASSSALTSHRNAVEPNIDTTISSRASQSSVDSLASELSAHRSSVEDKIELIKQVESGRWKIENNQMIFYKDDNVTELFRFNLYDRNGAPAEVNVYERRRV